MQLISEIEIGYFRSIYKSRISNISDMNIFFGRNDAGKSNIIRALNLFFEDTTNPDIDFDFNSDLCHARLAETQQKTDARKFVYVKLTFNTPQSWQKSLGKQFYVKKSWSITRQYEPNIETSIRDPKKRIYLTRFLNKIKFHYIPAIKDRVIFSNLLEQVYSVLSKQHEFNQSLSSFSQELKARTAALSAQIEESLGIKSNIAPPSDLTELFRALDFDTTNIMGDKYSLTLQRGDGVQVRHIPAIISFLSDHDDFDFNIWGFEEPENSLELASAILEAKSLLELSKSDNKQIFITSHSPAFFNLDGDPVSKYYVSKEKHEQTLRQISSVIEISDENNCSELMGETPHLSVISGYLKKLEEQLQSERLERDAIQREIDTSRMPILFVEGESDKIIITAACKKIFGDNTPFNISACNGTTKMEALSKDGGILARISESKKIFVLVDNDKEGRSIYNNSKLNPGGNWIQHNSNKTYWARLPIEEELSSAWKRHGLQHSIIPGVIENCLPISFRKEATKIDKYKSSDHLYDDILDDKPSTKKLFSLITKSNGDERMLFCPIDSDYKIKFAEHVANMSLEKPEILCFLEPLLQKIGELINKS